MENKKLKEERYKLYKQSTLLQKKCIETDNYIKSMQLRDKQDKAYKKWKFYDEFIKAQEKLK